MKKLLLLLGILYVYAGLHARNDLTVVGPVMYADGLGRLTIGIMDCLHNAVRMNCIRTHGQLTADIPQSVFWSLYNQDTTPGLVSILYDMPWTQHAMSVSAVPQSLIKLAYSMLESTAIPMQWVQLFNTQFDAVVVPDQFLVEVYKSCGVKVPIFVVPCGAYLEPFLARPVKQQAQTPFVFGMSAGFFSDHKNHELLIDAFTQEFGNEMHKVKLKIHGRIGDSLLQKRVLDKVNNLPIKNIEFINKNLTASEYLEFMSSLDCYVLVSKGEGFSITPREALALGIPCILSDTTAHKTICKTGFVRAVPATQMGYARYPAFGGICGCNFSPLVQDVRKALRDVYNNYNYFLKRAHEGRVWVQQYVYKNLKDSYLALIKPQKVVYGEHNSAQCNTLTTSCPKLYEKYLQLQKIHGIIK